MTPEDELEERLSAVAARYDEPHRRYHTSVHLGAVLTDVDRLLAGVDVDDEIAVHLAALFHDAVYDPRSDTNEADSAALARTTLDGFVAHSTVDAVERLVLATAHHEPSAPDEAVLLDADLTILSAEPDEYGRYVSEVRAEHAHVDDAGWRTGRAQVLRSFLDRDRIFHTEAMADREHAARTNLELELRRLGS